MKKYGRVLGILLAAIITIMSIFDSTQIPIVNPKNNGFAYSSSKSR